MRGDLKGRMLMPRLAMFWAAGLWFSCLAACASRTVPDPRDAARDYARAAEQGDAEALYGMMTSEDQKAYGREGVQRLVGGSRSELGAIGKSFGEAPLEAEARAELAYEDGEVAVLEVEQGAFRVASAGTLPAGAVTPAQALSELRWALARRSYPALVRVLTQGSGVQMEDQMSSLVRSLEHPEAVDVVVQGDRATVQLPEGHRVSLRREGGVWKVEDFR